jgi:malate synthase
MVDIGDATITGPVTGRYEEILTPEAVGLVVDLQRRFGPTRSSLLAARTQRRDAVAESGRLDFLPQTAAVREDDGWRVAEAPPDLRNRRVEITGPVEAKMLINAWNSGAQVHLADLEDANTPNWDNVVQGQLNLIDANEHRLVHEAPDGKHYELGERTALPLVRPRGWHLPEKHVIVDDEPVAGAFFDFGLYFFHNARRLIDKGSGPYFYLPKMESHLEARLWNDVFVYVQEALDIPKGTIRATVLIETIWAAFEMEEILYELREHSSGLNAGRWDYLFSIIKTFRDQGAAFVLPDRNSITMTVPFMRAYTELLVATCHRRGAFAIGGMAAFIPSRRDPEVNEQAIAKVRADKEREAGDGFDGTWVAHPDLVPVAMEVFDSVLGDRPNQVDRQRPDVQVAAENLLDVASTPGAVTEAGVRNNVSVGIQYIAAWLGGNGAVGIYNLMEDVATAEIARSQIWQWVTNEVKLDTGETVTDKLVRRIIDEEMDSLATSLGADALGPGHFLQARAVFEQVALGETYIDFLTEPAYQLLP